mgnify:CR=1 FL=1
MFLKIVFLIYILYIFLPVVLLFLKKKYLQKIRDKLKYIFLVYIITPFIWIICNNRCLLTIISRYLGYYKNTTDESIHYSEFNEYLKIIYKPIIIVFNMDYNDANIYKVTGGMSIIPIILLWYVSFYRVFE